MNNDFRSGMSSYAYLKILPIDYLKIDGAFVRCILENNNDMAVVKSISAIGHFMSKKIVTERVEEEQLFLKFGNWLTIMRKHTASRSRFLLKNFNNYHYSSNILWLISYRHQFASCY